MDDLSEELKDMNLEDKPILMKINKRIKDIQACGNKREKAHNQYQINGYEYDKLKKSFYAAFELSLLDGDILKPELQRYKLFVREFDKQILAQINDAEIKIKILSIENVDPVFMERIEKIKTAGLLRNKSYLEFVDNDKNYETAKVLFFKETSLALRDGLITESDKVLFYGSAANNIKEFSRLINEQKQHFIAQRKEDRNSYGRYANPFRDGDGQNDIFNRRGRRGRGHIANRGKGRRANDSGRYMYRSRPY